jgi:YihY family inner membrane protein
MSTATWVPVTRDRVGDSARATLRAVGRRRLASDALDRFRAADGFSHARALAFAFALTLLPAVITIVGLATALEQTTFTRVVGDVLRDLAPAAAGDVITEALRQGTAGAHRANGALALALGGLATLISGTTAFGQLERGANRIYGIERDRPSVRKYGLAAALLVTAGLATTAASVLLIAGGTLGRAAGWGDAFAILRWPVIVGLVTGTLALLFKLSPWRQQPEASWLVLGAVCSAVLWLALTGTLALTVSTTTRLGATYGPVAGTIAVLLWTLFSALAILFGLALTAQLEAVRAGVHGTHVGRVDDGDGPPERRQRSAS